MGTARRGPRDALPLGPGRRRRNRRGSITPWGRRWTGRSDQYGRARRRVSRPRPRRALAARFRALFARIAQIREPIVGLENRISVVHRTTLIEAISQTQRAPQRTNRFFERALEQQILVDRFAVEFGRQPESGNQSDVRGWIAFAENVARRYAIEIVIRDRKNVSVTRRIFGCNLRCKRAGKKLSAHAVQDILRNA